MPPVQVIHLFPLLDERLMDLLRSLTPEEWNAQTVARQWKVKDVVAHLLDGNIRLLSLQRDGYFGDTRPAIRSDRDLVNWLNALNADWVKAAKRMSPQVLIMLHEATGKHVSEYYAELDLFGKAIFPVSWAGETESLNWMHLAREYTEKWLHQQQIRDAVNRPGIITPEYFFPFMQTFALALPHTFRNTDAANGTVVKLTVTSTAGGSWCIFKREDGWVMTGDTAPDAELIIDPVTAWKLFSKSIRPQQVQDQIILRGNKALGAVALEMVSVMA